MDSPGIYIAVGLVLLMLSVVLKITMTTLREVQKINGRVGRLEEWRLGVTKLEDERKREADRRFEQLEP